MANAFKLKNGTLFVSAEAPGGIYNSSQLKAISELCDQDAAIVKATEDQRLALFVSQEKIEEVTNKLKEVGLGIRHYQDGLHQPVACIGELCPKFEQDALGVSMDMSTALSELSLNSPLKIGINGCATCCVPIHTLDISIVGDTAGYRMSLGGKTEQLPEMAAFMAEGVPADKLTDLTLKVIEIYKDNAEEDETLQDVMERIGTTPFVEALAPYSQDAAMDDFSLGDPMADLATDSSEAEEELETDDLSLEEADAETEISEELSLEEAELAEGLSEDVAVDNLQEDDMNVEATLSADLSMDESLEDESLEESNADDLLTEDLEVDETLAEDITAEAAADDVLAEDLQIEEVAIEDDALAMPEDTEAMPEDTEALAEDADLEIEDDIKIEDHEMMEEADAVADFDESEIADANLASLESTEVNIESDDAGDAIADDIVLEEAAMETDDIGAEIPIDTDIADESLDETSEISPLEVGELEDDNLSLDEELSQGAFDEDMVGELEEESTIASTLNEGNSVAETAATDEAAQLEEAQEVELTGAEADDFESKLNSEIEMVSKIPEEDESEKDERNSAMAAIEGGAEADISDSDLAEEAVDQLDSDEFADCSLEEEAPTQITRRATPREKTTSSWSFSGVNIHNGEVVLDFTSGAQISLSLNELSAETKRTLTVDNQNITISCDSGFLAVISPVVKLKIPIEGRQDAAA